MYRFKHLIFLFILTFALTLTLEGQIKSEREIELERLFKKPAEKDGATELEYDLKKLEKIFSLLHDPDSSIYYGHYINFLANAHNDLNNIDKNIYSEIVLNGAVELIEDNFGQKFNSTLYPPQ